MQFRMTTFARGAAVGLAFAAQALSASAAIVTTLPTSLLDADATFSFSSTAVKAMTLLGVNAQALGNATNVAGNAWAFNMPVTEVTVAASLLPLSLTPESGKATGSALRIAGPDGGLVLANFALDFNRNVLKADLTTSAGTTKAMDIYGFNVADKLNVSMNGGLSLNMSMNKMILTSGARASFLDALQLPDFADAVMAKLDFGTMDINITPSLRMGVSDKAYVARASMVPEQTSMVYMVLGLLGLSMVSRRVNRN
jgi:hypothetical protein